jgi:hypothetical protein
VLRSPEDRRRLLASPNAVPKRTVSIPVNRSSSLMLLH